MYVVIIKTSFVLRTHVRATDIYEGKYVQTSSYEDAYGQ